MKIRLSRVELCESCSCCDVNVVVGGKRWYPYIRRNGLRFAVGAVQAERS